MLKPCSLTQHRKHCPIRFPEWSRPGIVVCASLAHSPRIHSICPTVGTRKLSTADTLVHGRNRPCCQSLPTFRASATFSQFFQRSRAWYVLAFAFNLYLQRRRWIGCSSSSHWRWYHRPSGMAYVLSAFLNVENGARPCGLDNLWNLICWKHDSHTRCPLQQ